MPRYNQRIKLRVELSLAYRLFAYFGWVEAIYNHLTVDIKEPDASKPYLINPLGLRVDEVTASPLIKIDAQGNVFILELSAMCLLSIEPAGLSMEKFITAEATQLSR